MRSSRLGPMTRVSAIVALGSVMACSLAAQARAAITPTRSATKIAKAIVRDPQLFRNASFLNIPRHGFPTAVSTTALTSFPRSGPSYGILSTGSTRIITRPNNAPDTSVNNHGNVVRGARDVVVLRIGITVPVGARCLSIGFRFLSEEFPEFTHSRYNDAFIAELDKHTWNAHGTRSAKISAPNNFANARAEPTDQRQRHRQLRGAARPREGHHLRLGDPPPARLHARERRPPQPLPVDLRPGRPHLRLVRLPRQPARDVARPLRVGSVARLGQSDAFMPEGAVSSAG